MRSLPRTHARLAHSTNPFLLRTEPEEELDAGPADAVATIADIREEQKVPCMCSGPPLPPPVMLCHRSCTGSGAQARCGRHRR